MATWRWARLTNALALGVSAWLLVGCTSDTSMKSDSERTARTSSALNASPSIGNFVLYAERSIGLGSHDQVSGGDVGVAAVTISSFGDQVILSDHVQVDQNHNLLSPSVTLGSKSQVGDVQTNALHNNGAQSLGAVAPYPGAVAMPPIPIAGSPTSSASNIVVSSHQHTALVPGAYGALTIADHAQVALATGAYSFSSVSISDHVQVTSDPGGVTLLISGQFSTTGWDQVQPSSGAASALTILVGGTDGPSASPPAASIGEQTQLTALLAAPHGTFSIAAHAQLVGAFAAFDITLADHVQATYQSGFSASTPGQHGLQQLTGYITPQMAVAPVIGPAPSDLTPLVGIGLPIQHLSDLKTVISDVSDPTSGKYRQFIDPGTFAANYSDPGTYSLLTGFAQSHGFPRVKTFATNLYLSAAPSVANLESTFYTNINMYLRPDGTSFYAPAVEPSLDFTPRVLRITGLDDYTLSHPGYGPPIAGGTGAGGSNPNGWFWGTDQRNAYFGGTPCLDLLGDGQVITLYEEAQFSYSDLATYINQSGLTGLVQPMQPGGPTAQIGPYSYCNTAFGSRCTDSNPGFLQEVALDIDVVLSIAPRANILVVENGNALSGRDDFMWDVTAVPNAYHIISDSWWGDWDDNATQAMYAIGAEGVTYLALSDDTGAFSNLPQDNLGSPQGFSYGVPPTLYGMALTNATLVGATTLTYAPGAMGLFAGWNETAAPFSGGGIFSGGTSFTLDNGAQTNSIPEVPYQLGAASASNTYFGYRQAPDVSANGQNIAYALNGQITVAIGTSASTPFWAGFIALVSEAAVSAGQTGNLGFLNPSLYRIAAPAGCATCLTDLYNRSFNDIADGSTNTQWFTNGGPSGSEAGFPTTVGYDPVTGLGSPKCGLLEQLVNLEPQSFPPTGYQGGPPYTPVCPPNQEDCAQFINGSCCPDFQCQTPQSPGAPPGMTTNVCCSAIGNVCGQACCQAGESCCNNNECCSGSQTCCASGCCDGTCLPNGSCCDGPVDSSGACCGLGGTICQGPNSNGLCCSGGQCASDGTCCGANETACGGTCCQVGTACIGGACQACPQQSEVTCTDNTGTSMCCDQGVLCCNGQCCAPGDCCNSVLGCATGSACNQ